MALAAQFAASRGSPCSINLVEVVHLRNAVLQDAATPTPTPLPPQMSPTSDKHHALSRLCTKQHLSSQTGLIWSLRKCAGILPIHYHFTCKMKLYFAHTKIPFTQLVRLSLWWSVVCPAPTNDIGRASVLLFLGHSSYAPMTDYPHRRALRRNPEEIGSASDSTRKPAALNGRGPGQSIQSRTRPKILRSSQTALFSADQLRERVKTKTTR